LLASISNQHVLKQTQTTLALTKWIFSDMFDKQGLVIMLGTDYRLLKHIHCLYKARQLLSTS